jgi:hypothetical protein
MCSFGRVENSSTIFCEHTFVFCVPCDMKYSFLPFQYSFRCIAVYEPIPVHVYSCILARFALISKLGSKGRFQE